MEYLRDNYPSVLAEAYQIEQEENDIKLLESIAKRRGCLKTGGELDLDKAANYVIDDFRNGRLGNISLECPDR